LTHRDWQNLVSGRTSGPAAVLLRWLLRLAGCVYYLVVCLRNLLYSAGLFRPYQTSIPVISIGNITVGGTGKTPLVIWLCNYLARNPPRNAQHLLCAVLTRGYRTGDGPLLDEPAVLAESCGQARIVVDPDRAAGAAQAIAFGANVLILDDGFQHRRLARDLDIVAIDATRPFGYDKVLPAGLLREPACGLKRAGAVVITRCDQVCESELGQIERRIRRYKADLVIARSAHVPICARDRHGNRIELDRLKGKRLFAFCGIGNPEAFLGTVRSLGAELVGSEIFDDHHHYSPRCITRICEEADQLAAEIALTTTKDWTKIADILPLRDRPVLAYLLTEIRFIAGLEELTHLIQTVLAAKISGE